MNNRRGFVVQGSGFPKSHFGKLSFLLLLALTIFKLKIGFLDLTIVSFLVSVWLIFFTKHVAVDRPFVILIIIWLALNSYAGLIGSPIAASLTIGRAFLSAVSLVIVASFLKERLDTTTILSCIGVVLILHPIFIVTEYLIPGQGPLFSDLFNWTGHYNSLRSRGFFNSTSSAGAFLGFCCVFWMYLVLRKNLSWPKAFIFISFALFPLTALSGLVISIVGYCLISVGSLGLIKRSFSVLVVSALTIVLVFFVVDFLVESFFFKGKAFYAFDLIKSRLGILVGLDGFQTSSGNPRDSLEKLLASFDFPSENVWFGNGYESKHPSATTHSDAGVIAKFHQFGVFGLFYIFCFALYFFMRGGLGRVLIVCWAVVFFKNDYFLSRMFFDLIVLVSFVEMGTRKHPMRLGWQTK